MNDELMFEYLVQMGAMRPEEVEMARKQKQIDALRGMSMESPQGQMIGKHYVAPSITQYAAQLGQGYMAGKGQEAMNTQYGDFNKRQAEMLKELRKKKNQGMSYGLPAYGMSEGE